MGPLPLDQIGAPDLAGILALHPFKWKVVVVNACYSGGFVPPLRGPGTLVLTAARSDRSSFGCGSDSDITYFGKARSEEHTSELQSLMRISYAVFCLNKKTNNTHKKTKQTQNKREE